MAKFTYDAGEGFDAGLDKLGRDSVKTIVMAGAEQCRQDFQNVIGSYHHIKTGSMQQNVRPGIYHEDLNSGWVEVYPQGTDGRGVDNAKKAFIIDRGYGARRTKRTGDKFITKNQKQFKADVERSMQAASDRLIADTFK